jgi:hypothetical protein
MRHLGTAWQSTTLRDAQRGPSALQHSGSTSQHCSSGGCCIPVGVRFGDRHSMAARSIRARINDRGTTFHDSLLNR